MTWQKVEMMPVWLEIIVDWTVEWTLRYDLIDKLLMLSAMRVTIVLA